MDPFLLTHSVNDFLFDIGSRFTPIGIRDQMVRGFMIATRLLAEKRIGPTLPLLVVGAGAAGATAAMVAATNDVPTLIVERDKHPFNRQLYCPTRFLCPSEYDWPSPRWRARRFPERGLAFPFSWNANYAGVVAASWRPKLLRESRVNRNLRLRLSCKVESPKSLVSLTRNQDPKRDPLFPVTIKDESGNIETESVAVVVACTGPGKERCWAEKDKFLGVSFWDPDTLQEPRFGLPPEVTQPRILLSGGGDGVLQDFLRVTTNVKAAGEIFEALPDAIQSRLAAATAEADEQFRRGFLWDMTRYNCRGAHILHEAYTQAVKEVFTQSSPADLDALDQRLTGMLRAVPEKLHVRLVHPCSHFSNCYPLNRILVLLLATFVNRKYRIDLILPYTQVLRVRPADGHVCPTIEHCTQNPHYVDLGLARCCDIGNTSTSIDRRDSELYHHVVLRHGIEKEDFFGIPPRGNPKEILPAHIDVDWY